MTVTVFNKVEQDGDVVVDELSAAQIAGIARKWSSTPWIVGMEFDDRYQDALLHHLRRQIDPPTAHRCTPDCKHDERYRPPVETRQLHYRAFRDLGVRAGVNGSERKAARMRTRLQDQHLLEVPDQSVDATREGRKILARVLLAHLEPFERRVVECVFERSDETALGIARELGVPRQDVTRILETALSKLRTAAEKMLRVGGIAGAMP